MDACIYLHLIDPKLLANKYLCNMPLYLDLFAYKIHNIRFNEFDVFQESYGRSACNWPDHWGHWFPTEQPFLQVGRTHRCLTFLNSNLTFLIFLLSKLCLGQQLIVKTRLLHLTSVLLVFHCTAIRWSMEASVWSKGRPDPSGYASDWRHGILEPSY